MSNSCWSEQLAQKLATLTAALNRSPRLALLGIGNELNGDDAAGVAVVRRLRARMPERPDRMLVEAGPAPENFSGPLRRFAPDWVLLVDAAEMGQAPGATAWLEWQQAAGLSASTHTLPPTVLSKFLIHELGCRVGLIVIQAAQTNFDAPMTPAVSAAVSRAARRLAEILNT
jgi:hydrogenase 3 maturation protease